jgi:predicted ABC-type ATPase
MESPHVVILAGPNGPEKSTAAPELLRDYLGITEFVNADVIAQGMSAFAPEDVALQAGKRMLARLRELANERKSFAFETTLAARSYSNLIARLHRNGYRSHLVFLWLPSAELAIRRVASRVHEGGHDIAEETIRRRYDRGLINLFRIYMPLVNSWAFVG